MNIGEPDFDAAIEKSPSRCWLVPVPSTVKSWLYEIGVSDALVSFFERHSYVSWVQIGSLSFNSVSELVRENVDPQNHAVYKSRLLIIGSGLNGDPIVVNIEAGKLDTCVTTNFGSRTRILRLLLCIVSCRTLWVSSIFAPPPQRIFQ